MLGWKTPTKAKGVGSRVTMANYYISINHLTQVCIFSPSFHPRYSRRRRHGKQKAETKIATSYFHVSSPFMPERQPFLSLALIALGKVPSTFYFLLDLLVKDNTVSHHSPGSWCQQYLTPSLIWFLMAMSFTVHETLQGSLSLFEIITSYGCCFLAGLHQNRCFLTLPWSVQSVWSTDCTHFYVRLC